MTTSVGCNIQMFARADFKVHKYLLYLHEKRKVLSFAFAPKEAELHYGNEMCVCGRLAAFL